MLYTYIPANFMYHYFHYVNLFLENSLIFSHYFFPDVFGITWAITYSKKLHNLKTSAELFWVIFGLILMEFLYVIRAVKPSLKKVCKNVFCIIPMLTALKRCSQQVLLPWRPFWGIFWSAFWYFVSLF